ncbi:MAG: hypothetical protein PW843_27155 [Azospirillaceae bacterium]|nr:hypothetical protein [Azospirillaceae bacterium]
MDGRNPYPGTGAPGSERVGGEPVAALLPPLLDLQARLEVAQRDASKVDGRIIGTGEPDFTQDNVSYLFDYAGQTFQLVDVPGIEGDESKYADKVRAAIAKAHLVFYVSGNKKPEAETARKIRAYLNRYAVVQAICNIRGKADSYEYPEDRIDLELAHKDAQAVREQTSATLLEILGPELLRGCVSVQGMLGFCALAHDHRGLSTIAPERGDLAKWQASLAKDFPSPDALRQFSRVDQLADIIRGKAGTFQADIVAGNFRKIIRLIDQTVTALEDSAAAQRVVAGEMTVSYQQAEQAIENAFTSFRKAFERKCDNAGRMFFNTLRAAIQDAIERTQAKAAIKMAMDAVQKEAEAALVSGLETAHRTSLASLKDDVEAALNGLQLDLARIQFRHEVSKMDGGSLAMIAALEGLSFSFSAFKNLLWDVGSYALSGMSVGSVIPGLGNLVGVIAGAVVGAVINLFKWFLLDAVGRAREVQAKILKQLEEAEVDFRVSLGAWRTGACADVRRELLDPIMAGLDADMAGIGQVGDLVQGQIQSLKTYRATLEAMADGKF